ncbi:citrate lyase subunit beta/citryl-CoA lyase [Pararhizobium capsulatum DSM 1112]|uniref:Citrate lyase subunit beta/citryl-CoA lyase n=1 Tax=Pararhizobium capsulatum DSM 1112 TaxID=1121113 RepID=A0ABU0BIQ3_9HYPH|nr:CoA ester lyase [Pararhizobium capsulatum]MDQ0318138.1 citrate lyase subunit beta/citryl-CoA lyase [Pararhizobium capsulatum DSM 1112]
MNSTIDRHPARLRRSVLCVPTDNERALAKIAALSCDAVVYDLEDAVLTDRKAEARAMLAKHLGASRPIGIEIIIRINSLNTLFGEQDLIEAIGLQPDAILLPKVESPQDIQIVADILAEGDAPDGLRLWAMIETPRGVFNAAAIAETGRTRGGRLDCFVPGLNDLRKETGAAALPGRQYLVPWLMQILLSARSCGLDVIDSVFNDFRDGEGLDAECRQGRDMGFDGKMLIHPAQIQAANAHFGVSPEATAEANAIIEAFALADNAGKGVINLSGRMVERLHLDQAQKIAAKVKAIQRKDRTA